jgi:hypothetical protein
MSSTPGPSVRDTLWSPEKRVIVGMLVWLGLLALGSGFGATPFQSEVSAGANIIYPHVMYLHGLLIGMVGLLSLITIDVFGGGHRGTAYQFVLWGTLGATVLSGIGGIFDRSVTDTFPLWVQIVSFFFLDEILISLSISLFHRAAETRIAATWLAALSALSMLIAAIMGHIAGWMLEFGDWPKSIIGGYAALAGLRWQDWMANLIGSHSHEMVTGVLALLVATTVGAFGLHREGSRLTRFGLWLTSLGVIGMTLVYVVAGFSVAQPPTLFAHGANGLAGDDLVTGVGVMLGGLLTLVGLALERLPERGLRWFAVATSAMVFVTVVAFGYYIEFQENLYGAGDPHATRAAADAVFTWWHQDFAFFLLPSVLGILLALQRMGAAEHLRHLAGWTLVSGAVIAFVGGLMYIFVDPSRFGPSFSVTSLGLFVLAAGVVVAIWSLFLPTSSARDVQSPHVHPTHA